MKKVFMYVGFGVIVVFVLVMALCSAFGGSESVTVEDKVAVNVPEGVAVPVSDSKTEAYRNSRVSTEQYFAQLSTEEDISLVSDDDHIGKVKEKPLTVAEDEGAAAKRVFGDADVSTVVSSGEKVPVKPRMAGNNGPVQMTPEQKLEYDRKRAEMVRRCWLATGRPSRRIPRKQIPKSLVRLLISERSVGETMMVLSLHLTMILKIHQ